MEQVMKAERERRARITEAEGIKTAAVLQAEGQRDARIAEAEGERQAQIAEAKGRAEAIREIADAKKRELELLAEQLGPDLPSYLVALRYMESVDKMADNQNVVWMPHSVGDLGSYLGGFKHLLSSNA
jgi:regulator of protease activity HflC (stomatin/prohibitin superfamily)